MGRPPDFIGLGAQRSGTSWIYACLYEHPQVYAPVKELHFFSRVRNWSKGYEWYESIFGKCPPTVKAGEFSTSYLFDPFTPERIHGRYPNVKLILSLRNPVDRAYSNYMNDIMSGAVDPKTSFEEALPSHPEYLEQGYYAKFLGGYLRYFQRSQLLILICEDSRKDPRSFIQSIYRFIGVDQDFVPSMLFRQVNVGRVPRSPKLERLMGRASESLRATRLRNVWWLAKKAGIGAWLRSLNTHTVAQRASRLETSPRGHLLSLFEDDIRALEQVAGRELREWRE